mmetsp:Transcript_13199/g.18875  ORF Transcript_13199/g.18875 Transcript_13199/m.18875 type:complete len:770 (-) Transcript_13199:41-2350(-)
MSPSPKTIHVRRSIRLTKDENSGQISSMGSTILRHDLITYTTRSKSSSSNKRVLEETMSNASSLSTRRMTRSMKKRLSEEFYSTTSSKCIPNSVADNNSASLGKKQFKCLMKKSYENDEDESSGKDSSFSSRERQTRRKQKKQSTSNRSSASKRSDQSDTLNHKRPISISLVNQSNDDILDTTDKQQRKQTSKTITNAFVTPSPALTRSRLKILNIPTSKRKSPKSLCSSLTSSIISSTSSIHSDQAYTTKLPEGVIDIDSIPHCCNHTDSAPKSSSDSFVTSRRLFKVKCVCIHQCDHNHAESLSESYLANYGKDHQRFLRADENTPFGPSTDSNFSPSFSDQNSMSSRSDDDEDSDDDTDDKLNSYLRKRKRYKPTYMAEEGDNSSHGSSMSDDDSSSSQDSNDSHNYQPHEESSPVHHQFKDTRTSKRRKLPESSNSSLSASPASCLEQNHMGEVICNPVTLDNKFMDYMPRKTFLSKEMRAVLMDWLIELAEEYKLEQITLHLAVALVDRCLARCCFEPDGCSSDNSQSDSTSEGPCSTFDSANSKGEMVVTRTTVQCLGCACMMISCKIHEKKPPTAENFAYISANSYTSSQVKRMELRVCTTLRFHLHCATPQHFVHRFLRASAASSSTPWMSCTLGNLNKNLFYMFQYLLELSFLVYEFAPRKASLTAASALYLARATLNIQDKVATNSALKKSKKRFWSKTLEYYTEYDLSTLETPVRELHKAHKCAEKHRLQSIFEKYQKEKYNCVALKPVLPMEDLGFD